MTWVFRNYTKKEKTPAVCNSQCVVQFGIHAIDSWARIYHMEQAFGKCSTLKNGGNEKELHLARKLLKTDSENGDLETNISKNPSWTAHSN